MAVFEDPKELSVSEIVKYLGQKGGRSTNHELVSQFRKFLNDPARQVETRLQFKDIVNTVATVQDEEGVKYIALKKKYSTSFACAAEDPLPNSSSPAPSQPASPASYISPYAQSYQPYWRYRLSCDRPLGQPLVLPGSRRYSCDSNETQSLPVAQARSSPNLCESNNSEEWRHSISSEPIYENTSSLIYQNRLCNNSSYTGQKAISSQELQKSLSEENSLDVISNRDNYIHNKSNSIDIQGELRYTSQIPLFTSQSLPNSGACHRIKNEANKPSNAKEKCAYPSSLQIPPQAALPYSEGVLERRNSGNHTPVFKESVVLQPPADHQNVNGVKYLYNSAKEAKGEEPDWKTIFNSNMSSSSMPIAPPRRRDTIGKDIRKSELEEKLKQKDEVKKESPTNAELQQLNLSSGSVMERVQKLDRLSIEIPGKRSVGSPVARSRKRENRHEKVNEDEMIYVSMDPKVRKQWFIAAAKCDYHELAALLKDQPKLASLKDIASGYTALHWAAKHGNTDVVKLIAGAHRVNPNIRSHGGYTAIHVATLYKHKGIVDLLIKTYGADATLRDHSGKRADQYPDGYISRIAGSSRPGQMPSKHLEIPVNKKRIYVRPLEKESSGTFIRIGSLNLKVARSSTMFASVRSSTRMKTWSSADSVSDFRLRNSSNRSFHLKKKKNKKGSEQVQRNASSKQDSDSDSAYGFRP